MKKDFGFFIIVDIVFLAVSVWFFIVSGLFHVDSETNLWFAATYILTTLCVVVFLPSAGFLNIRPLWRGEENKKTLQLLSKIFLVLAACSAICYRGDTESFLAFFLIFSQLVGSFILIIAIEILVGSVFEIGKLFRLRRVY